MFRIRWDGIKAVASVATDIVDGEWYFKYKDEENDHILVSLHCLLYQGVNRNHRTCQVCKKV